MAAFTVTRQMINDSMTEPAKQEMTSLAARLAAIPEREDRLRAFEGELATLSPDARAVLELIRRKETEHVVFANAALDQLPEFAGREKHDFSKDWLYFFTTSLKFDCGLTTEGCERLAKAEIDRHFRLEAHHPQWEEHSGRECSETDIWEMAIDRLSRNIQVNSGSVSAAEMAKYMPVFPLGDNQAKQQVYLDAVNKYTPVVTSQYWKHTEAGNVQA